MPHLHPSRACEQRLQAGHPLTGSFQAECLTTLAKSIADLGCVLEQMHTRQQIDILQDQLAAMHEHLTELMNQAARKRMQV